MMMAYGGVIIKRCSRSGLQRNSPKRMLNETDAAHCVITRLRLGHAMPCQQLPKGNWK